MNVAVPASIAGEPTPNPKLGCIERIAGNRGGKIHVTSHLILGVAPEQRVGNDRCRVDVFQAQGCRARDDVVDGDQIVAARDAIVVAIEDIVEDVNALGHAGGAVVLDGHAVVHEAEPHLAAVPDEIALDHEAAVLDPRTVNELNAVIIDADDLVAADGDGHQSGEGRQRGSV